MEAVTIPVLQKAIDALEWVASQPANPTSRDIAEAVGIAPTTCYRILHVFQQRGWLRAVGGRFGLGWGLLPVCRNLTAHPLLGVAAGEILTGLAHQFGHTVKISVREQSESVTLRREEAATPYGLSMREGTRFPLVVGASGTMLLAQCSPDDVARAIAAAPADAWKLQTRARLKERIERARAAGWCHDDGSYRPDIFGLSVPLKSAGLGGDAVLTVTGLMHGLSPRAIERWIAPLQKAAAALERLQA